jgi:hypothetical protein
MVSVCVYLGHLREREVKEEIYQYQVTFMM